MVGGSERSILGEGCWTRVSIFGRNSKTLLIGLFL